MTFESALHRRRKRGRIDQGLREAPLVSGREADDFRLLRGAIRWLCGILRHYIYLPEDAVYPIGPTQNNSLEATGTVERTLKVALYVAPLCPAGHLPHTGGDRLS